MQRNLKKAEELLMSVRSRDPTFHSSRYISDWPTVKSVFACRLFPGDHLPAADRAE